MSNQKKTILTYLKQIEQQQAIKILYACESGSRAWGFASPDSDYDIRFFYLRPMEWYWSIEEQTKVIQLPLVDLLDVVGWDLSKALLLMKKSNVSIYEWLDSPMVYYADKTWLEQMKSLAKQSFMPQASLKHYWGMANKYYQQYQQTEQLTIKSYFYLLRPLLACVWLANHHSPPPVAFAQLLNQLQTTDYYPVIVKLLTQKSVANEQQKVAKLASLDDYIHRTMASMANLQLAKKKAVDTAILQSFFNQTLIKNKVE